MSEQPGACHHCGETFTPQIGSIDMEVTGERDGTETKINAHFCLRPECLHEAFRCLDLIRRKLVKEEISHADPSR